MKNTLFVLFYFFSFSLIAQTEKTLFWEISGNGLAKKSYLYGTMHVNEKISYHLSDAFYKHLLEADIVSNESNPENWDELFELLTNNERNYSTQFYSEFNLKPLEKEGLFSLFSNFNIYNAMLSGNNSENADFQENTVLDMFIHQTGRKYNKKVTGLEDAKKSFLSIMKMKNEVNEPKEEVRIALTKILKNRNYLVASNDYYREKDIVMLDSLYKLMYSKKSHDILITTRNVVMAKSIDSIAKTGSLFAAIGAAHLAGKKGVIQLLIDKGYTVKPILDKLSPIGEKQKKTIEEYFPNPTITNYSTKDGMIKMPLFKSPRTINENTSSIDLTNGGSINLNRIPLNYFLKKDQESFNPSVLDSLFFENIPGTIIEKKAFESESYKGFDIKNKSKAGNTQHYRYYITPLEIIGVSMTGTGEYVRQYENQIFDKIELKSFQNNWDTFSPSKGGFSVEIPSYMTIFGNEVEKLDNDITIQSYDNSEKAYYFLEEKSLKDNAILEDTAYEHKQIQSEFYMQNDIENVTYSDAKNESSSAIKDKKVRLKTIIKGNKYVLLGTVNASDKNSEKFFNSFVFQKLNHSSNVQVLNDSIAKFKVEIPSKTNEKLFLKIDDIEEKTKNTFLSKYKNFSFYSNNGETVDLEYNKFHKYQSYENLDSLKTVFYKGYIKDYSSYNPNLNSKYDDIDYHDDYDYNNRSSLINSGSLSKKGFSESNWYDLMFDKDDKYEFISKSYAYDKEKNVHIINAIVSKPKANQAIKYKTIIKENSYYELKTLIDKEYKNDNAFIEKTFDSFDPIGKDSTSVFEDKFSIFMKDVYNKKDTIRFSAIESVNELTISEKDYDAVTQFLNSFKFKDSETSAISSLLFKIGALKDARVIPFLEEKYKDETTKTEVQIAIIKALTNQKSKQAYQKIIDLLEYDLPITDNQFDVNNMFYMFERDLENSKELFPKIFQFYSIKEYNKPTLELCNSLFDKGLISPKKISTFKKMVLTNAKLESKRVVSWKEKNASKEEETEKTPEEVVEEATTSVVEAVATDEEMNYESEVAPVDDLINYINLLYNFQSDKEIDSFFRKIELLDIQELKVELLRLGFVHDKVSKESIQEAINNPKTKFPAVQLLLYKDKHNLLPTISDEEIVESAIINFENLEPKDSLKLIDKRIETKNNRKINFFFYKYSKKENYQKVKNTYIYPIAFVIENDKINPLAYKVFDKKTIETDDDEKAINKKIETIINQSLNDEHSRATFEKEPEVAPFYDMYD